MSKRLLAKELKKMTEVSPEMQEAYRKRIAEMQKAQQAEQELKLLLRSILDPAAFERMMNIKMSSPETYMQVAQVLIYSYRNGQLRGVVSEQQLKQIASQVISSTRRETKIVRK